MKQQCTVPRAPFRSERRSGVRPLAPVDGTQRRAAVRALRVTGSTPTKSHRHLDGILQLHWFSEEPTLGKSPALDHTPTERTHPPSERAQYGPRTAGLTTAARATARRARRSRRRSHTERESAPSPAGQRSTKRQISAQAKPLILDSNRLCLWPRHEDSSAPDKRQSLFTLRATEWREPPHNKRATGRWYQVADVSSGYTTRLLGLAEPRHPEQRSCHPEA
ncbi:hypothetical protein AAFF_G00260310 [Aldrovandia affinis]|uniref:Uncharacterized protein n=1 Tax=Aldrovandia affinis TaxID=143900 RepID=A0AAD7RC99_9TELE|nr:hypothetical protein AAFF_G00260310 [Aldrovandia affinis]